MEVVFDKILHGTIHLSEKDGYKFVPVGLREDEVTESFPTLTECKYHIKQTHDFSI